MRLASGCVDETIKLWDVGTGVELKTLEGHDNKVLSVAFSPDGRAIASGSGDKTIKLWDSQTGAELKTLTGHSSSVLRVTFSPDGKTLASAGGDETIKLWSADIGAEAVPRPAPPPQRRYRDPLPCVPSGGEGRWLAVCEAVTGGDRAGAADRWCADSADMACMRRAAETGAAAGVRAGCSRSDSRVLFGGWIEACDSEQ